jgi:hypothetical protein
VLKETKTAAKKQKTANNEAEFNRILKDLPKIQQGPIKRARETGQFLSVMPSTIHGTDLSADEFRDGIMYRYYMEPNNLQKSCDGCGAKFSLIHAVTCMKGGLIIARHDEIRDELCDIGSKAFTPSAVRDEPNIHIGRNSEDDETVDPAAVQRNLRKK